MNQSPQKSVVSWLHQGPIQPADWSQSGSDVALALAQL
jgi:hypothetical protein